MMCDFRTNLCKAITEQVMENYEDQIKIFESKACTVYEDLAKELMGYEMLAGHNRQNAGKLAGLKEIPAIMKENLPDDEEHAYVIKTNLIDATLIY